MFNKFSINESESLTKHISCEYKCGFDEKKEKNQVNVGIMTNFNLSVKDIMHHAWNPSTCNCKNGKYLAIVIDDSAFICHEIIESYDKETKTVPTNFN